jgi:hypothetical protein
MDENHFLDGPDEFEIIELDERLDMAVDPFTPGILDIQCKCTNCNCVPACAGNCIAGCGK